MSKLRQFGCLCLCLAAVLSTACSKDVKIGAIISESGAVSSYGEKVKKALELALEEINDGGGVNGGKIELIFKDDATNPDRGRQVAEELIKTEGTRIIIGAIGSTVTLSIAPICEKNRVVLLSPCASVPELTDAGQYIYRNWPSDILEGTAMARFARDLGLERVAIFAMDNEFGHGLQEVFSQQYAGRFREIVKTFKFDEGDLATVEQMVAEVKELNPDGVYIVSYPNGLEAILAYLHEAGVDTVLMGSSSVTETVVQHVGVAAESLVYPQPRFDLNSEQPAVASFVAAYRKKYREDPDIYAAHGYDALKLLVEAMRLGGSDHPMDVQMGLRQIKEYEGGAGQTTFDSNGDVVRYPRMFIVHDAQTMPYDKFVEQGGSLLAGT